MIVEYLQLVTKPWTNMIVACPRYIEVDVLADDIFNGILLN